MERQNSSDKGGRKERKINRKDKEMLEVDLSGRRWVETISRGLRLAAVAIGGYVVARQWLN